MQKHCKRCDRTLPIEYFSKDKKSSDEHAFYCKACCAKYTKQYNEKNKRNPVNIYNTLKWNAEYHNKSFNLEVGAFISWYNKQSKICRYCGVPEDKIPLFAKVYGGRDGRLSVDCKDNSIGYHIDNIVLACDKCNSVKNNVLSYEQMCFIGESFIKPLWLELIPRQ